MGSPVAGLIDSTRSPEPAIQPPSKAPGFSCPSPRAARVCVVMSLLVSTTMVSLQNERPRAAGDGSVCKEGSAAGKAPTHKQTRQAEAYFSTPQAGRPSLTPQTGPSAGQGPGAAKTR